MALTDNLVSYWKLDESSGNAADAHGSNTLTNNNTTAYAAAIINNGADFETTSSQWLSIADASQSGLDLSTALTFAFWYKPESTPGTLWGFVSKQTQPGSESFWFAHYPGVGGLRLTLCQDGGGVTIDTLDSTISFTNGTWYHVAVTWLGSSKTAKFYINGSQNGGDVTGTNVSSIFNGTAAFVLGDQASGAGPFYLDGMMDEVGVWSRVLTDTEISQLYNAGNGFPYPFNTFFPKIRILM